MDFLSELDVEDIVALSDESFRESVQDEARSLAGEAFDVYREVMSSSDDDVARLKAADKILSLSGIEEKQTALPSGVSEEVFKLALAGLGQLAGIARTSPEAAAILRNVTPAKSDPRPMLEVEVDDSPMNRREAYKPSNDEVVNLIAGERYEIIER